ncbi:MAG: DUF5667 domain-containing protein [Candidatus Curtissbacteria bacterium]
MKRVLAYVISFLLLFLTSVPYAYGQVNFPTSSDGQINEALSHIVPLRIIPDNPFYFLITGKEIILRALQPSSAKRTQFDMILSGKRLKESYLLAANGDLKNASRNMVRYSDRLKKMVNGLDKAKSQNQDVSGLASEIAENLRSQEVLFFAIGKRTEGMDDEYGFDENYQKATLAFVDAVGVLNDFKPGIRDRFRSATNSVGEDLQESAPRSSGFIEASPSIKPNRIIY